MITATDPGTSPARARMSGAYQRKEGRQRIYTYSGVYGVNAEGTWWLVTVRHEEKLKGTPTGIVANVRTADKSRISKLIERQIETLDQVTE